VTGTPFDRQHRGSQGDADLAVTLTVIVAPALDCGHIDIAPDIGHNDGHQTVCADCCPTCNEEAS